MRTFFQRQKMCRNEPEYCEKYMLHAEHPEVAVLCFSNFNPLIDRSLNINHSIKMKKPTTVILGLLICAGHAYAEESWNFQSYNNDETKGEAGYFSLMDEKDGKGTLVNYVRKLNVCWQGNLQVTVKNTADEKIITAPPKMNDCATVRFVLKNDGAGGTCERLGVNGKWIKSAQDRGLQKR